VIGVLEIYGYFQVVDPLSLTVAEAAPAPHAWARLQFVLPLQLTRTSPSGCSACESAVVALLGTYATVPVRWHLAIAMAAL